jgi:hypothetical protein
MIQIQVDPSSVRMVDNPEATNRSDEPKENANIPMRIANAYVALDEDDLLKMPSIAFSGMDKLRTGRKPDTYKKMAATKPPMGDGSGNDETVWQGAMMGDRVEFATFFRGPDGTLTGSFTDETTVYVLATMPDGTTRIQATLFEDIDRFEQDSVEDMEPATPTKLTPIVPEATTRTRRTSSTTTTVSQLLRRIYW